MCSRIFGHCLFCQTEKHSSKGCVKVNFRKGSCCMTCGFPQILFGERIHGDIGTGECEKGLRDLMKGVCWGVYRDVKLKEKYLKDDGSEIVEEEKYKEWIIRMDTSGEMINGCRFMLNIWRDRK